MPKYEGTVYRSLSLFGIENMQDFIDSHVPGEYQYFSAYTSTGSSIYDESMPIQYVIKSKNGRDIRKYNSNEFEVLYRRGSKFKILKVEKNTIYMED
jgi:hypothetical protein